MHRAAALKTVIKPAYLTVFFNGGFIPQKQEGSLWYNLCKLPLKPLKAGSTQVFIDTSGEAGKGLELFAKNKSEKLEEQTFTYTAVNGGVHTIVIKDKSRPSAPTANPAPRQLRRRDSLLRFRRKAAVTYIIPLTELTLKNTRRP